MTSRSDCEILVLFEQRRDLFRRLLELSRAQMQLLAAQDYPQLLALQGEKQRLLADLEQGNRDHLSLKDRWRTTRDRLPERERAACQGALDEQESLVAEILQEERQSAETLERQLHDTQRQLAAISRGRELGVRYQSATVSKAGQCLDLEG